MSDSWTEVFSEDGNYWWNQLTGETTEVNVPRPTAAPTAALRPTAALSATTASAGPSAEPNEHANARARATARARTAIPTTITQLEIEVIENGEESVRYIVNDNMLVEQLKLEIMKKRNIKPKNQLLTDSTGKVMEDKETTLWEYNIREPLSLFFSIDMEDKHINVKINGNIIDYTYTDTDTIYDLKCKIFRREGTGIHGIRLVVGRNTLQDEELIQNYHGQTITFVLRSLDPYRRYYTVRYEDNHGNAKSFVIPDSQTELTIQMVKEKIGTALGIPFNNQVLKHGNIVLRNNEVLGNKFVLALEVVNQGGRKTRRRRGRRRQKTRSRK